MTPGKIMFIFGALCVLLIAAIPHILWVLGWVVSVISNHHLRYAPFGWTALALAIVVILSLSYGFFIGRWRIDIKELTYYSKDIPASFDGFRVVHISDLHLSTFDDRPDQLEKFVDRINDRHPDLVCFTGDLVTSGRKEAEPYTETLSKIVSKHGVISVLGNHDFLIYERRFKSDAERDMAVDSLADYELGKLGWKLLRNASTTISAPDSSHITIVGVDNRNCSNEGFRTIDRGDLKKAMAGTEGFRILLSHDPSHWDAEVLKDTDIQLTLSGHTHAAQISLFGWNPASLMFARSYGRYDENGQTLYVNPGLGCTAPFRIGAHPEITVITLKSCTIHE